MAQSKIERVAIQLEKAGRDRDEQFHKASLAREAYRRLERELHRLVVSRRERKATA